MLHKQNDAGCRVSRSPGCLTGVRSILLRSPTWAGSLGRLAGWADTSALGQPSPTPGADARGYTPAETLLSMLPNQETAGLRVASPAPWFDAIAQPCLGFADARSR